MIIDNFSNIDKLNIDKLKAIIIQKQQEIMALQQLVKTQPDHLIAQILDLKINRSFKSFKSALRNNKELAVIAEIKRQSPSKGKIAEIKNPVELALKYVQGGANAISVLTDEKFFNGSLDDLQKVSATLKQYPCPVLRKDFIIHEIQIAEAIAYGADAILCIVAVLGNHSKRLLDYARKMGIEVIVEVHNIDELNIALDSGAEIIGVNNRNLSNFEVETQNAFDLINKIPDNIIKIAESGILEPKLAQRYYQSGFDAVLIGEGLVKSENPENFIKNCKIKVIDE